MKLQDMNNLFNRSENLPAQNGQTLATILLNDLPVGNAGQIKGGPVVMQNVLVSNFQTSASGVQFGSHSTGALINVAGNNTW
ncbi:MAG TPA: hypothetical protein PLD20_03740 [Blastocatellia bacterium]|mgnify:CR=1 FL=1|nr:hypothetical protein [Blastocatellia bacterium]HMV86982.1 hypothetical protein [Blastocatellia bacterium]HMX27305.1 hypothetical protein [Blastocatellia bacterium]HMY75324.1 hypothetical protein [Blastocatellia bacterium]HMZ17016.1 hypothetical protein [Blastocatellia bacterium]